MSAHERDRMLDSVARRQHGAIHRRQVLELGFTPRMIDGRRASGEWVTMGPSLYALASHPYTWLRQAKAAELSIPGAAVSHRAAAFLHEVPDHRPGPIDLTVPVAARHVSRLATVHRSDDFTPVRRQLITVTSLARTVADLAEVIDHWRLERTVDHVLLERKATVASLLHEADRATIGHRPHVGDLRELLVERGDGYVPPSSELEAELYAALDDPRLPRFVRQASFGWWQGVPRLAATTGV